jgi:hypothetical protein
VGPPVAGCARPTTGEKRRKRERQRELRGGCSSIDLRTFAANALRLERHTLAYNLGNFMRTLAMPRTAEPQSLTSLREKLIKIGTKGVTQGRYVTFQLAEIAVSRLIFADILSVRS